jgi:putative peptidoglycan lipid II flippase
VLPRAVLHASGSVHALGRRGGDVIAVGDTLSAFAIGLIGFSVYLFVLRAFYARQDTRTPFLLNCLENAINIVFAVVLVGRFGVEGLAIAYAIAYCVSAVISTGVLVRRLQNFDVPALLSSLGRVALAATAMGVLVMVVGRGITGGSPSSVGVAVVVAVLVGIVAYAGLAWILRLPQETGLLAGRGRDPGGGSTPGPPD